MTQPWLAAEASTRSVLVEGGVGRLEVVVDTPDPPQPRGLAVVAHPQPLLGGSAQHKVPQFLARALRERGWLVLRPNFRGVGASEGRHDQGLGETDDLFNLTVAASADMPLLPLVLVGFSFGAFVQSRVAARLLAQGLPLRAVMVAGLPAGEVEGGRRYDTGPAVPGMMVVHGERDERVPLASVLDWARPQNQPVTVVPGADHVFTGRLPLLRDLLIGHLRSLQLAID